MEIPPVQHVVEVGKFRLDKVGQLSVDEFLAQLREKAANVIRGEKSK